MFRSHPGWRSTARQAVFAVLPVLMGAAVLGAAGDARAPAGMSRLEATQASVAPLLDEGPAPAAPVGEVAGETAITAGPPASDTAVAGLAAPVAAAAPAGGSAAPAMGDAGTGAPAVVGVDPAGQASVGSGTTTVPPATSTSTTLARTTTTTTTTVAAPAAPPGGRHRAAEAEVVPLTNGDRLAAGLGALSRNACLDAVAAGYAEQMARSGVLAHNPGVGAGVTGCRANAAWGDNVGMSSACDTARLEQEWMASPGHRRNILTAAFTLIGVGAWTDGQGTCWVQVLFSS
jgi:uncharacterized protein YkwD